MPAGGVPDAGELTLHVGGATVEAGDALSAFAKGWIGTAGEIWQDWEEGDRVSVRLTRTGSEDTTRLAAGDLGSGRGGPGVVGRAAVVPS